MQAESMHAEGYLIETAGTDDVAAAYATVYPIALVTLVLLMQMLVGL